MAEARRPDARRPDARRDAAAPAGLTAAEKLIGAIIIIVVAMSLFGALVGGEGPFGLTFRNFFTGPVFDFFQSFYFYFKIASLVFSLVFLYGIVYSYMGINEIRTRENAYYNPEGAARIAAEVSQKNAKWERIQTHIASDNPSDWKLAILEADIMLDLMLDRMGYMGETIGDKLKRVERSDFNTIDNAWEAHKIRNAIAHQGADFVINQREARRVVELYRSVFEEFFYI
ncbi:MAG: hypothetical protein Q7S15_01595 [bacterium]|nr:hypothetical protein [bacterium]